MSEPLLSVDSLSCERGYRRLFDGLDFSIRAGEAIRIAGPNGAGKSTLLKVISGISTDYDGDVLWCGKAVADNRENFFSSMLYLGHAKAVKKSLTVKENLDWFRGIYPCRQDVDIQSMLDKLGLGLFQDTRCGQLSAGQQQRVALARLLMSSASLWILDEPFTAVDQKGVGEFEIIIDDFLQKGGAVIVTTHHHLNLRSDIRVIELGGES